MRRALLIALGLAVLGLLAVPAYAQGPTATPEPTSTPLWLFGVPIVLPTAWPGVPRTPIPISYTPAPNLNPLGLGIDSGDIVLETSNMSRALGGVMGATGRFLNFVIVMALAWWAIWSLMNIFRKAKRMIVAFREPDAPQPDAIGQRLRATRSTLRMTRERIRDSMRRL